MSRPEQLGVALALLCGLLVRVAMALHLGPHIDEPASVLALHQVAETGFPFLPSGVLYLQGATLSYLSAPLHWLGLDGPGDLFALRTVPLLAGMLVPFLTWVMVREGTQRADLALAAVWMIALDPVGVQWSAHLRPYSLLELIAVAIAWRAWRLLQRPSPVDAALVPGLFLVGAFTHLLVLVLLPGLLATALWMHGRTLLAARRDLLISGALCLVGPALVLLLNQAFGVTSAASGESGGAVAFVGNHLLSLTGFMDPNATGWRLLHLRYGSMDAYSSLFLVLAGVLAYALRGEPDVRGFWALLGWLGLVCVALFSSATDPRYVLHLHLFTVCAVVGTVPILQERWGRPLAVGVAVMLGWGVVRGCYVTWVNPVVSPDYRGLHGAIAREPDRGALILTPMPAVTWWSLPQYRDRLVFLAGAEDSPRPGRYTHAGPDGPEDFWLGGPSVVSRQGFCELSAEHPDAWILYDQQRLRSDDLFGGIMGSLLRQGTEVIASGPGDTRLARFRSGSWRKTVCAEDKR